MGAELLCSFSENLLWSAHWVETECLLDGTVKQQLPPESAPVTFRMLVLIALSSERSSFAVAVEPSVHFLHR
jgi:hypothetical protein